MGRRAIFGIGLALYGVSFFLIAVASTWGAPIRGYDCAGYVLLITITREKGTSFGLPACFSSSFKGFRL